MSQILTDLDP